MKIVWRIRSLQLGLAVLILVGLGSPVRAAAAFQSSPNIDVYGMSVEDGDFIYLVGSATNLSGQLPAGSLDQGGGMSDIWVEKLRKDGTPVFQALVGGKANDIAYSVAVRQGVIYVLGETWSTDFPGAPGNAGENDALVLALSADGGSLLWARRFGGSDQDSGRSIVAGEDGLYLTGITWSIDFQPSAANGDADGFLARLDFSGDLKWLKVFGGRGLDAPFDLATGPMGIWVVGETLSTNLAGRSIGNGDVFAMRFGADGTQQLAGLYGGTGEDVAYAAALAPDGSLYLAGDTQSAGLPGARGQAGGQVDGFFMHIGENGGLLSTSYLGGSGQDSASDLVALPDGSALVTGDTRSADFPAGYNLTTTGLGAQDAAQDAYIARFDPTGALLSISRQGGTGEDDARAIQRVGSTIALAGSFSVGNPPYILLLADATLLGNTLPTCAPPIPTATIGPTATTQPTETPGPTITPQPTETLAPEEIDPLTETPVPVVPIETQVNEPSPTAAPSIAQPESTRTAEPPLPPTQTVVSAASLPQGSSPTSSPESRSQAGGLGTPIGIGLTLVAVLLLGAYWLRRKSQPGRG